MGFVNRKSNYELMRIVAMIMIVMGHFWGQSNYAELAAGYSYYLGGILSHGSRIAVNVFLFMGIWFMLEGEFKASRILKLYFNLIALILDILRRKYVEPIIMKSKLYLQLERKINEFYKNV